MSESAHHRCGGSVLARRITCTASLLLEAEIEEEPRDAAFGEQETCAEEGTRAHALLEACVMQGIDAADYVVTGKDDPVAHIDSNGIVEPEMIEHVQGALDLVNEVVPLSMRHEVITERKLMFPTEYVPEDPPAFGTVDLAWIDTEHKTLYQWDLKYGFQRVQARENPALRIYSLALIEELEFFGVEIEWVDMSILQPRLGLAHGWERISVAELKQWGREVVHPKILEAQDPKRRKFAASPDNCRYCHARGRCKARANFFGFSDTSLEEVVAGAAISLKEIELFSEEEMIALTPELENIVAWAKAAQSLVSTLVQRGEMKVPGYGHVTKLGNRKWRKEVSAELLRKELGVADAAIHDRKLKSPAQIEKLLPSQRTKAAKALHETLGTFVERVPGAPKFGKVWAGDVVDDPTEGFEAAAPDIIDFS